MYRQVSRKYSAKGKLGAIACTREILSKIEYAGAIKEAMVSRAGCRRIDFHQLLNLSNSSLPQS